MTRPIAKITYIAVDGQVSVVDADPGRSVMEAAVKNVVPGIVAECGGSCACGACRVFVEPDWHAATGEPGQMEQEMLAFSGISEPGARLSCSVKVTEELDGLVVRTPGSQY